MGIKPKDAFVALWTIARVGTQRAGNSEKLIGGYFEWTGSAATAKSYYATGGVLIALRVGSNPDTTGLGWVLTDHLGSLSITTHEDGTRQSELRYKP